MKKRPRIENDTDTIRNLKCIVIGDTGVGKTALIQRLCTSQITDQSATIGIAFNSYMINPNLKLSLWDTAGQERFRSIIKSFFRGMHLALIVFDVTSQSSFQNIDVWLGVIRENQPDMSIVLIGNKCDLEEYRVISREAVTEKYQFPYLEFSVYQFDKDKLCSFLEEGTNGIKPINKTSDTIQLNNDNITKRWCMLL
jgi:small GTP-binding protein